MKLLALAALASPILPLVAGRAAAWSELSVGPPGLESRDLDAGLLQKRATCGKTSDCTQSVPANAHRMCSNRACTFVCNSSYTKSGTSCTRARVASTTKKTTTTSVRKTTTTAKTTARATTAAPKTTTKVTTTAVRTTAPAATTTAPAPSPSSLEAIALKAHNDFRAKYGVPALVWDDSLAQAAQSWTNQCKWEHSGGSLSSYTGGQPYGEDLAAITGSGFTATIADGIQGWTDESAQYNYNNPGFSEATGHFTQVVWKSTIKVGCAQTLCPKGSLKPINTGETNYFWSCEYLPAGNYEGEYVANVPRPIS